MIILSSFAMAKQYPFTFSELKSKVGIDDVAHSLGYRLDKKAGVGRYYELVLGDPKNPTDKIVVKNTSNKSDQFFFRRDGRKGDVISFIRENLNSFNVVGDNEWSRVANVLANLANMPVSISDFRSVTKKGQANSGIFDPKRYEISKLNINSLPWIIQKRGFVKSTIEVFSERIVLIKDKENKKFDGFNIGFPYMRPDTDNVAGYEIRGSNGYKSKAAGTDSAHTAWMVDFPSGCPHLSRNVYFFESSFDAMAFYQMNKAKLETTPFSLVSVGGAFNPSLATSVMVRYPLAKAWDCFDNDLAGQMYSAALVKAVCKVDFEIGGDNTNVILKYGDKNIQCPKEQFDFKLSASKLGMSYSVGHWKSPSNFKDWNDCLLGRSISPKISPSKYQRDDNLFQKRQAQSLKM